MNLHFSDNLKSIAGLSVIFGQGFLYLAFQIYHFSQAENPMLTFFSGVLAPSVLSVILLMSGVWIMLSDLTPDYTLRVAEWSLIISVIFGFESVLTILHQEVHSVVMAHQVPMIVNPMTGGAVVGMITGIYESQSKMASDNLREEKSHVKNLNQQLSVLNRILRHNLRNTATVVKGRAALLEETCPSGTEHIGDIQEKMESLLSISEKIRVGEEIFREDKFEREVVDIVDVIQDCVEEMRRNYPEAEVETTLPDSEEVLAVPLIELVFENLIENGIEHNDKPSPRVEIELDTVDDRVKIQVKDNGSGIPESVTEVLNQKKETPLKHTSGVGLWLVKWIVSESEGAVEFRTKESGGTVVSVYLQKP